MRVNSKFKIEMLNGQNVIIDCDNNVYSAVDFSEIKMFLWQLSLGREITKQQMLDAILNKFEISTVLALGEIDDFIRKLKEYGII